MFDLFLIIKLPCTIIDGMKLEMLLLTCIKQLMRLCNVIDIPDFKRFKGRHGRDRMVVGLTTTYAMSAFHH